MFKLVFLGMFLASLNPEYEQASNASRRALLEMPQMKEELKEFQNKAEEALYLRTGLTKDDLILGAYAYPLLIGKVSTKPFKNFKYETSGWTFRPEVEYDFYDKEYKVYIGIVTEF